MPSFEEETSKNRGLFRSPPTSMQQFSQLIAEFVG